MWKRFILLIPIVALLLTGCDDNTPAPEIPSDGDDFNGPHKVLILGEETDGLTASDITVSLLAENGTVFTRQASHSRSGGKSTILLDRGLAEGTYRLLAAHYPLLSSDTHGNATAGEPTSEFGLGSRIRVTADGISVIDSFNPTLGYAGEGTKDNPFVISSSSHLFNLMMTVNDYDTNRRIGKDTYFIQVCDIDMKQMSRSCDMEYGWLPIGADTNTPFRGVYLGDGHAITSLIIKRPNSAGIGLFGFVCDASIDGLAMRKCDISGQFAVGTVAGAVITSGGNNRGTGTFTNCTATDCNVSGPQTSASLGGILGATDMHSKTLIADCSVTGGSLSGGMNVGGLTGGAGIYSSIMISGCENSTTVTSLNSGAGGMIGTADTLHVAGCTNRAAITGSTSTQSSDPRIGTGGIAGGAGMSWITGSRNTGTVTGYEGVGGIIGSTRVRGSSGETFTYNQSVLRQCSNSGNVSGLRFVGGAIGEAQAGTYGVCNTGKVSATDYVGGICGNASVAVIHNSVNGGDVQGASYVAGILGKCTWGSLAIDQNMGKVNGSSGNTAGVLSLAGNNTVVHYCANFGEVTGPSSHPVGGIIAEIGDPRKWTAMNIAECVVGSLECVMAVAGPVLAVVEGTVEMAEAVEIIIKIVETSIEVSLQTTDYVLVGFGIDELINPELEEALSADMRAKSEEAASDITEQINTLRRKSAGNVCGFTEASLATSYIDNINKVVAWYETEGNDEKFNEAINEAREKRAEQLEKYAKAKEIAHTVIAGVAVVSSTVALVAGTIASGGAATAFLVMGSTAAVVGGVNAIVKSCTEFEKNAVVVSQCLNAGQLNSPGNGRASSIVGLLCDGCVVYDCVNTAKTETGSHQIFVADNGSNCEITHCVSTEPWPNYTNVGTFQNSVVYDSSLKPGTTSKGEYFLAASPEAMGMASTYTSQGFAIGEDQPWNIPAGFPFAIPNISQMQE